MDPRSERIYAAARFVSSKLEGRQPLFGIVLGSGLGQLAEKIEDRIVIQYSTIPEFPLSTAIGHKGNFIVGFLGGKCVIAMQGRFHYYEGYPMESVTLPIRVMMVLGVKTLFVSNAAGGTNPDFHFGDLMIIKDHISLLANPLIGQNLDEFGPRFLDMTCAYDPEIRQMAHKIAGENGYSLKEGVYFASTGPTYETPAEIRFFRLVGADAVGMSTVPEVIVARHCGMRVFGLSVITNIANTANEVTTFNDGDDVVRIADAASERMSSLFESIIRSL